VARTDTKIRITAKDATKSAFRSVLKGLKGLRKAVFSLKAGFVLLAGVTGIGLLIRASLKAIDTIGKLSKTYGIATKDLRTFELAAALGGSSLATFAKAAKLVSKNVFDFVITGSGEATDAFEFLGITVEQLDPIMNDQVAVLGLIADRMNLLEDGSIKTALAYDLLGGRALELLPVLRGGSKEFEKIRREAELFGIALDEKTVQAVEAANDAMTRLKFVFIGLRDQTTAALSPALEELVDILREVVLEAANSRGGIRSLGQTLARILLTAVKSVGVAMIELVNLTQRLLNPLDTFKKSRLEEQLEGMIKLEETFTARLERTRQEFNKTHGSNFSFADLGLIGPELRNDLSLLGAMQADVDRLRGELEAMGSNEIDTSGFEASMDRMISAVDNVNTAAGGGGGGGEGSGRPSFVRILADWRRNVKVTADKVEREFSFIEQAGIQAARNIQTALADFLFEPFQDGVSGMVRSFADALRRMAAEAASAEIIKRIFGSIPLFGGTAKTEKPPPAQHGFDGIVSGSGGTDSKLFTANVSPRERITITPAGKDRGGGSFSFQNHITINNPTGSAREIRQAIDDGVMHGEIRMIHLLNKNGFGIRTT